MPIKFAAQASGICEDTYYNWMQRGEEEKTGPYAEFLEYIKECQAAGVEANLKLIKRASNAGSWQASAWILERRYPEEFGRREKIDMKSETKLEGGGGQVIIYIPDNGRDPGKQKEV